MTIKGSGQLGLNGTCTGGSSARDQIGAEVNKTAGTQLCLNNACLRTLSGTSGGTQVSFSTFYGKSSSFTYTVSANQTNFCMRAGAVSAGWNQSSALVVNINSGVIISSNSTGTPAMTISGAYPGGVTVTNSGTIVGMGGNGGAARQSNTGAAGSAGGTALRVTSPVTFNNPGTISGGGGGGGGGGTGGWNDGCFTRQLCGGGGGGGRSSNAANSSGGGGSVYGSAGGAGTYSGAGGGGAAQPSGNPCTGYGGPGGPGGGWGASGSTGTHGACYSGVGYGRAGGAGGGGGKATCGAGTYITWGPTGTRNGSIS